MFKKLLLLFLAALMLPHEASALIIDKDLGEVIVTVEGNKRTKPLYIESLVRRCLEKGGYKTWETVDGNALGQCIRNTKLFESIEVQVDKPVIHVKVSDRWTLIPIPSIYASNGKRSGGATVFESNFLGIGKTVGIGGSISTEGNTFNLMYFDPSIAFSDFTFNVMAFRSSTELRAYDRTTTLYGYDRVQKRFFLSPGYVTPFVSLSVSAGYADNTYSQLESFSVPGDYTAWTIGAKAAYHDSDYKLFYNDGFSANISWDKQVRRSDSDEHTATTTAGFEWDKLLFEKHALQLGLRGATQSDLHEGEVAMYGRSRGYRGIQPGGLWTRRIVAASVDYQIPVAKWGHGTVTVAPFADYGVYRPYFEGTGNNYASYGIGAYYFINLINLPGIGLTAGVNENFMGTFVAFQIGMGFN